MPTRFLFLARNNKNKLLTGIDKFGLPVPPLVEVKDQLPDGFAADPLRHSGFMNDLFRQATAFSSRPDGWLNCHEIWLGTLKLLLSPYYKQPLLVSNAGGLKGDTYFITGSTFENSIATTKPFYCDGVVTNIRYRPIDWLKWMTIQTAHIEKRELLFSGIYPWFNYILGIKTLLE